MEAQNGDIQGYKVRGALDGELQITNILRRHKKKSNQRAFWDYLQLMLFTS